METTEPILLSLSHGPGVQPLPDHFKYHGQRGTAVHFLKTWQPFFREIHGGLKPFELRYDDRQYLVGDMLVLRAYSPSSGYYWAEELLAEVTYVLRHYPGIAEGWVILGLSVLKYQRGPVCIDSQAFGYQRPGVEAGKQLPAELAEALSTVKAHESKNRQAAVEQGFYARYYGYSFDASPYSDAGGYGRGGQVTQANGWRAGWRAAEAVLGKPIVPAYAPAVYGRPMYKPGDHLSWQYAGERLPGNGIVASVEQERAGGDWIYLVTNHHDEPQHVRQQFVTGLFVF